MRYKIELDEISRSFPFGCAYFIFRKTFYGWKRLEFSFDNLNDANDQLDILEGRRQVNNRFIYTNEDI